MRAVLRKYDLAWEEKDVDRNPKQELNEQLPEDPFLGKATGNATAKSRAGAGDDGDLIL